MPPAGRRPYIRRANILPLAFLVFGVVNIVKGRRSDSVG
jgi:hypothetical protein